MATTPQAKGLEVDSEGNYVLPPGHRLPGWTVDALLGEGKVEEARAELERLLNEGVDSGPGQTITPEYISSLRQRARRRASLGK